MIYCVNVVGRPISRKLARCPVPKMCSSGSRLVFVLSPKEDSPVEIYQVDPLKGLSTRKEDSITLPFYANTENSGASVVCNGTKIIFWSRFDGPFRKETEDSIVFQSKSYNLLTGKLLSENSYTFIYSKTTGFPFCLCYDARNNMIWGFDDLNSRVLRWKNGGLTPYQLGARPSKIEQMIVSSSPGHRLEALKSIPQGELDSNAEAAILLCQIDRIAENYGPPRQAIAEYEKLDYVEIFAAGSDHGSFSKIFVRGLYVTGCDDGVSVVVLDKFLNISSIEIFLISSGFISHTTLYISFKFVC